MSEDDYVAVISIRNTQKQDTTVVYEITIEVSWSTQLPLKPRLITETIIQAGPHSWKCFHRYRDFADLNEKLVNDRGLAKDLLPKKKVNIIVSIHLSSIKCTAH